MKIDIRILDKSQLLELIQKLSQKMAVFYVGGYQYKQNKKKYSILMNELKIRRERTFDEAPEVIRRDTNNQFGVIDHKYYQTLNPIDQEIYINWKWVEM